MFTTIYVNDRKHECWFFLRFINNHKHGSSSYIYAWLKVLHCALAQRKLRLAHTSWLFFSALAHRRLCSGAYILHHYFSPCALAHCLHDYFSPSSGIVNWRRHAHNNQNCGKSIVAMLACTLKITGLTRSRDGISLGASLILNCATCLSIRRDTCSHNDTHVKSSPPREQWNQTSPTQAPWDAANVTTSSLQNLSPCMLM